MTDLQASCKIPLAHELILAALAAADPAQAVRRHIHRDGAFLYVDETVLDLGAFDEIVLIGVGKASVPMAREVLAILVECKLPIRGVVVTKYGHLSLKHDAPRALQWLESAHPVPDENSLRAGEAICQTLSGLTARTLVLACISGGASALAIAPHEGISLGAMRAINDALLRNGADIVEMNAVRSRLDRLKGGALVRLAQPARVIGLVLSDVIGDLLHVIASGMTHDPQAQNVLVGNNTQACAAVAECAKQYGYTAEVITTTLRGEAREVAARIVREAENMPARHICIYGGETTVTVKGQGKGGRNQELALAAAIALSQLPGGKNVSLVALGTDGTDGPTDAAGAIADPSTIARALAIKLDAARHLTNNDAYNFFAPLGDLIFTGPTGTNVADVVMLINIPAP